MAGVDRATAFAPATVANVAVGFDILGFAIDGIGDRVSVTRTAERGRVEIERVTGISGIPLDPVNNTATVGLLALCRDRKLDFGFKVSIEKGIPLGSGLGGSASSAVGGIVAANALLSEPLPQSELLRYALAGEAVASGGIHADNVAPCLLGGLCLVRSAEPPDVVALGVPARIRCVVVHPDIRIDTKEARKILKPELTLKQLVAQTANLAGFLESLHRDDLGLMRRSFNDVVIEPQRARLIPAFTKVQAAANNLGALGCSISGSGPSVFAWFSDERQAEQARAAMIAAFERGGVRVTGAWVSPISSRGAHLV